MCNAVDRIGRTTRTPTGGERTIGKKRAGNGVREDVGPEIDKEIGQEN